MSIKDERDLRTKLSIALDDLSPGPLPLGTVVSRGRAVLIRRWVTVAAVAAVVLVAAIATPAILRRHNSGSTPPVSRSHHSVTLYPPSPGAPRGLIAHGSVDGRRWAMVGSYQQASGLCFSWLGGSACGSGGPGPARVTRVGDPVTQVAGLGTRPLAEVWTVRGDVAYLLVSLTDGQVLRLRPVAIFGPRYASYVALVAPDSAAVLRISAYSAHGEIGFTVPFAADDNFTLSRWLRPGQAALPRPARLKLGSGTGPQDMPWSAYAYVGPWGLCFDGTSIGTACAAVAADGTLPGGRQAELVTRASGGGQSFLMVALAPAASYLAVQVAASGGTVQVQPVTLGGVRFCVFRSRYGTPVYGWVAYSAAGRSLASMNFGR